MTVLFLLSAVGLYCHFLMVYFSAVPLALTLLVWL